MSQKKNIQILIYEQAVYERDSKIEKNLLEFDGHSHVVDNGKARDYIPTIWITNKRRQEWISRIIIFDCSQCHIMDIPIHQERQLFIASLWLYFQGKKEYIYIYIYILQNSITKTIQVRRTRHAGHCWRSRDELIRDVLLWIPTHGRAKAGRPARTYIQQLCEDTGCCPEDLPRAMNDREEWRERVRDIRAASTIWWWWWYEVGSG